MKKLDTIICSLIKKRLKGVGLSYKDVAEQMSISEVSVKRLLNMSQPLSTKRLVQLAELAQVSLSQIVVEAEKLASQIPTFTANQDKAFCDEPELYTVFSEICGDVRPQFLMKKFQLDEASLYLYLRKLESIGLIEIVRGCEFKLLVSKHICFSDSNQFPMYFKNQIIDSLKEQVQNITSDDAYFITAKFRLTEEEFKQYNTKLEELMLEHLKITLDRDQTTINTSEYTIVDMGAKGAFHPELMQPKMHNAAK
ncbi:helix-turn-helix transcriptional regulator [Vibrio profundum]|uniref:helix-turn-helix domain-containing protein n=1 Tax=Vibrio profundum TaxID=2910247 RepID=UPI003D0DAEAE